MRAIANRPRVVIVGAGFGGLRAAKRLRKERVDVLVVDRQNFHTFLPLLYEVAAAGLEPDSIAQPVRAILRGSPNMRFRMGDVERVDLEARCLRAGGAEIPYDYLIVAAGSTTNFFGMESVERHALGLKDLREATAVRNRILRSFERAVTVEDDAERDRLMTIVIAGGGPTGVELAGALAELKRHVLPRDYPDLDLSRARVILLEAMDRLLSALPQNLQRKAAEQLTQLGVEVRFGAAVASATDEGVVLADGSSISAANVIWVAGVVGADLAATLAGQPERGRRVRVLPTLQLPAHPEVFVIGDLAHAEDPNGAAYPMVAPVAMQQGDLAARNILALIQGASPGAFRYRDSGTMATIGRKKAVAHVFGLQFSGFIAWVLWLVVHLLQIVDLRSRALVLLNWVWNYYRYDRGNRIVTDFSDPPDEDPHRT